MNVHYPKSGGRVIRTDKSDRKLLDRSAQEMATIPVVE